MIKILENFDVKKEASKNGNKIITIELDDVDNQLYKLLNDINNTARQGHSFHVVVDPGIDKASLGEEQPREYFIDGDGAFLITKIKENTVKIEDIKSDI